MGRLVYLVLLAILVVQFAGVLVAVVLMRWAPVFFAGATIAGVGFGAGFQGANPVLGGVLAVHGGVAAASREYGGAVMALAAITLLGLALAPRVARRARPAPAA